jgi:uncharacterized protein YdaU (DUF1376 family)
MRKPNAIYFRFSSFIADTSGMTLAAVGAHMLLCAYMLQRWQPEQDPFPFLPDDEKLLAKLCNRTKTWHRVREEVLPKFNKQDGKLTSPWVNDEVRHLTEHWKKDGAKKEKSAKQLTPVPKTEWGKIKFEKDPKGQTVYYLQGRRMVGDEAFRKMCKRRGAFVYDRSSSLYVQTPDRMSEKTVLVNEAPDGSFTVNYVQGGQNVL